MPSSKVFKLGTRGSVLALRQAAMVRDKIQSYCPDVKIEFEIIKTSGDRIKDRPLADVGGKGLFTKEIDHKLLQGDIDFAVHSMKDVETFRPHNLDIFGYLERNDPRDVFISKLSSSFDTLPQGAKIGTCSPRRCAQILALRPDLQIVPMRGNVDTRLQKLSSKECDALILAYAGLQRLEQTEVITEIFDPYVLTPAVAQGVIGIEIRQNEALLKNILTTINHQETAQCVEIERQFLKGYEGDCRTAIAGWAQKRENEFIFQGTSLTSKGEKFIKQELRGSFEDLTTRAFTLGREFKIWYQAQI